MLGCVPHHPAPSSSPAVCILVCTVPWGISCLPTPKIFQPHPLWRAQCTSQGDGDRPHHMLHIDRRSTSTCQNGTPAGVTRMTCQPGYVVVASSTPDRSNLQFGRHAQPNDGRTVLDARRDHRLPNRPQSRTRSQTVHVLFDRSQTTRPHELFK